MIWKSNVSQKVGSNCKFKESLQSSLIRSRFAIRDSMPSVANFSAATRQLNWFDYFILTHVNFARNPVRYFFTLFSLLYYYVWLIFLYATKNAHTHELFITLDSQSPFLFHFVTFDPTWTHPGPLLTWASP